MVSHLHCTLPRVGKNPPLVPAGFIARSPRIVISTLNLAQKCAHLWLFTPASVVSFVYVTTTHRFRLPPLFNLQIKILTVYKIFAIFNKHFSPRNVIHWLFDKSVTNICCSTMSMMKRTIRLTMRNCGRVNLQRKYLHETRESWDIAPKWTMFY